MTRGALALLFGCASAPPTTTAGFPADAYQSVQTDAARVELRTAPSQPPQRGTDAAELVVMDASGKTVDGLTLTVVPWMPSHGHGSTPPSITAEGNGRYRMDRVSFFMPGSWELRVTIAGAINTQLVVPVEVQ